jgi:tRNA threonylcarbamoyladenosine biosynthesis protein TsaE
MSTVVISKIESKDSAETERLGGLLGSNLRGGEVIELRSDLGGGKTTLTKGIARGVGSTDVVSSPTFMVCRKYLSKEFNIFHYDFYRVGDSPEMVAEAMGEQIRDKNDVIIIEWADSVVDMLDKNRLIIEIHKSPTLENERGLVFHTPSSMNYLMKGIIL